MPAGSDGQNSESSQDESYDAVTLRLKPNASSSDWDGGRVQVGRGPAQLGWAGGSSWVETLPSCAVWLTLSCLLVLSFLLR